MCEDRSYWRAITQHLLEPENKQDLGPKVPNYRADELEDDREFIESHGLNWKEIFYGDRKEKDIFWADRLRKSESN